MQADRGVCSTDKADLDTEAVHTIYKGNHLGSWDNCDTETALVTGAVDNIHDGIGSCDSDSIHEGAQCSTDICSEAVHIIYEGNHLCSLDNCDTEVALATEAVDNVHDGICSCDSDT